jgi:hypothetical protein
MDYVHHLNRRKDRRGLDRPLEQPPAGNFTLGVDENRTCGIDYRVGTRRPGASTWRVDLASVWSVPKMCPSCVARSAAAMMARASRRASAVDFPIAALASTVLTGLCLLVFGLLVPGSVQ